MLQILLIRLVGLILFSFISLGAGGQTPSKILFIGDSITDGYGIEKTKSFPALVENQLKAKGRSVQVFNAAISGALSNSAAGQLKWHLKNKPQIVVITLGGNDARQGAPVPNIEKNLREAVRFAKEQGATVILGGMKIFRNLGPTYVKDFEALYPRVAQEEKVKLIPFLLEGVGGVPKYNQADGFHPNEEGHKIIARTVSKFLEPLL